MFNNKTEKLSVTKENKQKKPGLMTNIIFLTLLSLAVTALLLLYIDRLPYNIHEGGIATQDIRADRNYEIVDSQATKALKEQASQSSPLVYDYDQNLVNKGILKLKNAFSVARTAIQTLSTTESEKKKKKFGTEEEKQIKEQFFSNLGFSLSDDEYKDIRKIQFSEEFENALMALFATIQKRTIVHDKSDLPQQDNHGIVIRILSQPDQIKEEYVTDFTNILSLDNAKNYFKDTSETNWTQKLNLEFVDTETLEKALALVPAFLKVTLTIDKSETEKRKERALSSVENIVHKLQKGQNIILRGERYTARHITILNGIRQAKKQTNFLVKFLGMFGLILLLLYTVHFYAHKHIVHFHPTQKDLYFIGLNLILFLAMLRFGSFLGSSLRDTLPFTTSLTTFYYIIPVAASAMMVRYILNAETALIFAIVLSFFAGMFLEFNYAITTYYFLSSIIAAHLIGHVEKRSSVMQRSLLLGVGNAMIVLGLGLITTMSSSTTIDYTELFTNCMFAFSGGLVAGLTLLAISPIMESLFSYTTNIQLLELANMNHPLLREMIVCAPGTYHHSQLVGVLAETGTRAIGGNPLLARVASYYHDIGKMNKPNYFVENQKNENPHDNLAPSMSALIVESHVKDGMEMAREHKLPSVISDFIPEHQGTKLISYFYHKAKMIAGDEADKISEKDYRYKGPKPQSREAGVMMLADTIEAAVRSMPDKSPQKIRAQVEKLVNMHFVDGQLNECELTLRDLFLITEAFVKTLVGGIYHHRVEYPEHKTQKPLTIVASDTFKDSDYFDPEQPPENKDLTNLFKEKRNHNS